MKRIGSFFDVRKYVGREHLLAPGLFEAAHRVLQIELDEPPKSKFAEHATWKNRIAAARSSLKVDVQNIACTSRVIAITTAMAIQWWNDLSGRANWHFVTCDEASQVPLPAALMLGYFGKRVLFAGDPNQLAPIVRNPDIAVSKWLNKTAFDFFENRAKIVSLNEQSRMCPAICHAVSTIFYDNALHVGSDVENSAPWKRERSPYFVNGREIPRVHFEMVDEVGVWSAKYSGRVRKQSAETIEFILGELLSYADPKDIVVLTPFRSQRTLIRSYLYKNSLRELDVSTVHKAQVSERKIVIFDPVDAAQKFLTQKNGKRLANVAVSRAQSHVIVVANEGDFNNEWLRQLHKCSSQLWSRRGAYAKPFTFRRSLKG